MATMENAALKKILLVTPFYPKHGGGIEIVAHKLAHYLSESFQITWCAAAIDPPPESSINLHTEPYGASNIIEDKVGLPFPLPSIKAIGNIFRHVKRADIVHIHDFIYAPNILAFAFSKWLKKPIIITQHIGPVPYNNLFFKHALALLNKTVGTYMLKNSNHTFFISDHVKAYFCKTLKTTPSHWHYIPNGVDHELFSPTLERSPQHLLFVGRFVEKKGLNFLEKLAKKTPLLNWVFVGKGPLSPANWELPNVKVIDHVPQEQLAPLYQNAHLLLLPSVGEGFPLVIQEAMSCGTPILTSCDTAKGNTSIEHLIYSEAIDQDDSVQRWVERIHMILKEPDNGQQIAQFAHNAWNWKAIAKAYSNHLTSL